MAINNVRIPYPDFKMYEIIDPEQHDSNNAEIANKINSIITLLNSITGGEIVDNIHARSVEMNPVAPFNYRNVSDMLTALVVTLFGDGTQSTPRPDYGYDQEGNLVPISYDENGNVEPIGYDADGNPIYPTDSAGVPITSETDYAPSIPGAELVKISQITGITGDNVQKALESLIATINSYHSETDSTATDLATHKSSGDHDYRYYRKQEVDTKIDEVTKVNSGSSAYIEILEADPATPYVGQMWMVINEGGTV